MPIEGDLRDLEGRSDEVIVECGRKCAGKHRAISETWIWYGTDTISCRVILKNNMDEGL